MGYFQDNLTSLIFLLHTFYFYDIHFHGHNVGTFNSLSLVVQASVETGVTKR